MPNQATAAPPKTFSNRRLDGVMDALSPIRHILENPDINEIMINGPDDVFVRVGGRDQPADVRLPSSAISTAITLLASIVDKEVSDSDLLLSARLPGFRIECAMPPVSVKGPSMCIRRHASRIFSIEEYVERGVMTAGQVQAIRGLVAERKTLLIAGGTFSGKTTLMNSILGLIDPDHRLFVIEQVSELKIAAPNVVFMEVDPDFGVTPRQAVKTAMRYSPDRIILGELRGPEALDWLEAANTGHPGSAATLHANSANEALKRAVSLVLQANSGMPYQAIMDRVAQTVDAVIYIEHRGGNRQVKEVCSVDGLDFSNDCFITSTLG